jgi:hypothetical protein
VSRVASHRIASGAFRIEESRVLWTLVAILLVIILIPAAARSLPAVGSLVRRFAGAGANALIAVGVVVLVLVVGRRFLPALARAMSVEAGIGLAVLVLAAAALFLVRRMLAARTRASGGNRPPGR